MINLLLHRIPFHLVQKLYKVEGGGLQEGKETAAFKMWIGT